MIDTSTILFVVSIIGCIIGICTFVAGMNSRSQKNGVLEQKIDQALSGINELKKDLKSSSHDQNNISLLVTTHNEQLKTMNQTIIDLSEKINHNQIVEESLIEILRLLKTTT